VQCFKSEVVNGLGTDQRGGETSSAGVIDESGNPFTRVTDGSESGQPTASMNPESTRSATRHSRRSDGRLGGLLRPI